MGKWIKKAYSNWRDLEQIANTSSSFLLILAFIIVLPALIEIQMGFIVVFLLLFIGINRVMKALEYTFPRLKTEEDLKIIKEELVDKNEEIERRIKEYETKKCI